MYIYIGIKNFGGRIFGSNDGEANLNNIDNSDHTDEWWFFILAQGFSVRLTDDDDVYLIENYNMAVGYKSCHHTEPARTA
jgi:hypothetical protein